MMPTAPESTSVLDTDASNGNRFVKAVGPTEVWKKFYKSTSVSKTEVVSAPTELRSVDARWQAESPKF